MNAELTGSLGYLQRVIALRYFCLALVRNDLQNRYRRSFLGIAWSLARPIGMTIVLCTVFTHAFNLALEEYAPFLFVSIALWHFLVESMVAGCNTFKLGASYIRQQPIPLLVFPLRTVLGAGVHTSLALGLALLLIAYFRGLPSLPVLASVVPGLAVLLLLAVALATLLGILHTHFPDTQHLLEIALQGLFYLTPVMYRPDVLADRGRLSDLLACNPFAAVLELIRRPLVAGLYPEPAHCVNALAFLAVVGGLAWICLRRFERDLVFWI